MPEESQAAAPPPRTPRYQKLRFYAIGLLGLYWLALFISTHTPKAHTVQFQNNMDKLVHLVAYALLAFLLCIGTHFQTTSRAPIRFLTRRSWIVFGICAIYGLVDELLQLIVDRDCSVGDWIADCVGAALGIACYVLIVKSITQFRVRHFNRREKAPTVAEK